MSLKKSQVQEGGGEEEHFFLILFLLFVSLLTGQRKILLSLVFALVFTPFWCQHLSPLSVSALLLPSSQIKNRPKLHNIVSSLFYYLYTVLVESFPQHPVFAHPSICKPIHSMLFSVASLSVGLLFTEGGKEVESWKKRREGPEKSPKITVMQVDRQ